MPMIRGPTLPLATYRKRRGQALQKIAKAADAKVPLLVLGAPFSDAPTQLNATVGSARQDPWFDWFCGCLEPDAALLLDPHLKPRDTLFLEPGDPARVVWDGARLAPGTQARKHFGMHATADVADLRDQVLAAAERAGGRLALLWRDVEPGYQTQQAEVWKRRLRGVEVINAEPAVLPLRMIKDADEIALHRQAVKITVAGYKAVFKQLPAMRHEQQVAAELAKHYLSAGHESLAFATIAGGGTNAATLHYPHNDQPLPKKGGVLIDSGARSGGYAADVTRSVPCHGRFDRKRYREVYEIVLRSQLLGIKHARPGITLAEWNEIAWQPILDAGFTRHHGLGHHLGLDVHDPADRTAKLKPGMLITCEPGVYLADEGIGIRIEDDLVITADGCEVTTKAIPKTIRALERAIG